MSHHFFFLSKRFPKILRNSVNHVELLIKEIGDPFNEKKAKEISNKLEIQIRFNSREINWASNRSISKLKTDNFRNFGEKSKIKVGFTKKGPAIYISKKSGKYLFILHSERENFRYIATRFLVFFILFISIVIIGMYFIIKSMLKPVKILETGVKELSSGNIDYRMKTDGNDELGELIISFNLMTSEIKKMISARDQLLMDVSHELRSPLTRIKVALEFIEENSAKDSIIDDISDIEKMVTELLETERLNSPYGVLKREKIELLKLIQSIKKDFFNVKPGLKIEKPKNKHFIYADKERLKILFKNIIGNALKFSNEQTNPVEIILYEKNKNIIAEIKDYGKGIPSKDIRNIFEPFYRVDKSRSKDTGGYGLGMSLSKKIVEAHGGEITVKSIPGKGTTVSLIFKTG